MVLMESKLIILSFFFFFKTRLKFGFKSLHGPRGDYYGKSSMSKETGIRGRPDIEYGIFELVLGRGKV